MQLKFGNFKKVGNQRCNYLARTKNGLEMWLGVNRQALHQWSRAAQKTKRAKFGSRIPRNSSGKTQKSNSKCRYGKLVGVVLYWLFRVVTTKQLLWRKIRQADNGNKLNMKVLSSNRPSDD